MDGPTINAQLGCESPWGALGARCLPTCIFTRLLQFHMEDVGPGVVGKEYPRAFGNFPDLNIL
jgi:hypothetical protein